MTNQEMFDKMQEMFAKQYKGEKVLFNDYIAEWMQAKGVEVKRNTWEKYQGYCKNYFYPAFNGLMMTEVTKAIIQNLVNLASKQIAPRTVQDMIGSVLKPILKEAVGEKMIESNPAEFVKLPKVRNKKKTKGTALTDEEIQELFIVSKDHYQWVALPLLFFTGMRRSELLALTWDDVDLDNHFIYINKSLVKTNNEMLLTDYNKTEESTRCIPISEQLCYLLKQYKATYGKGRKIVIGQMKEDTYMDPNNFSRTFRTWTKKAGITRTIGVHAYRHTFITMCIQQHEPCEYIMSVTGHADPRMITHYADLHRADGAKKEVMAAVERYATENNLLSIY